MKLKTLKSTLQVARHTVPTMQAAQYRPDMIERKRGRAGVEDRARIKERDCGLCQECKRHASVRLGAKVDHRIPLWDSGSDEPENKQFMCDQCHDAKSEIEAGLRASGGSVPRPNGVVIPWDHSVNAALKAAQRARGG